MFKKVLLSLFIEFGPIIVFSILSDKIDFIFATLIFVIMTLISLLLSIIERGKIALFPIIVSIFVIIFGLLTYILNNSFYIIIKDTIYYGLFAIILYFGLIFNKSYLKPLFDNLFGMTEKGWIILTHRWAFMFLLLTIGNEYVRISYNENIWINYKIYATLITAIFSLYQFCLSKKYRLDHASKWGMIIK